MAVSTSTARPDRVIHDDGLSISLTYDDSLFVIEPFGELDFATSPRLRETIERAAESPARTILIDLSGLEFIDSEGIGILVRAAESTAPSRLRLLRGCGQVERTLELCGLDELLPFLD